MPEDAKATLLSLWPELPDEQKRPRKGAVPVKTM